MRRPVSCSAWPDAGAECPAIDSAAAPTTAATHPTVIATSAAQDVLRTRLLAVDRDAFRSPAPAALPRMPAVLAICLGMRVAAANASEGGD